MYLTQKGIPRKRTNTKTYTVGITEEAYLKAIELQEMMEKVTGYKPSMNAIATLAIKKEYDSTMELYTKI